MERFLLFIKDGTNEEFTDLHPDKPSAKKALIAYVRQRESESGQSNHINDDDAIAAYFDDDTSFYTIARVNLIGEPGNDR
jgi:hypothetical protein